MRRWRYCFSVNCLKSTTINKRRSEKEYGEGKSETKELLLLNESKGGHHYVSLAAIEDEVREEGEHRW